MKTTNTAEKQKVFAKGLRQQIVIAMVLVAIVPPAVLSLGLYYFNIIPLIRSYIAFNQNMLDQQLIAEQTVLTQKYAEKINLFFKELEFQTTVLANIATGPFVAVEHRQEEIQNIMSRFSNIMFMHSGNKLQTGIATPEVLQLINKALAGEIELRTVRGSSLRISDPFTIDNQTEQKLLLVALPAAENYFGISLFLVEMMSPEHLIDKNTFGGSIMVINQKGKLILQSEEISYEFGMDLSDKPHVQEFLQSGKSSRAHLYRGSDGMIHQAILHPIKYVDWALITKNKPVNLTGIMIEMEHAANDLVSHLLFAALIGLVSVGVLAGSLGALIALRFTKPLHQILEGIDGVAAGNYSYRFQKTAQKDLDTLVQTLNHMIDSIQSHTEELNRNADNIKDLFFGSVTSLIAAIDAKDQYTKGHSKRVQFISLAIGKNMGLSDNELLDLEISALMHDIGKIGIHDTLLAKKGVLSAEERKIMEAHPILGARIMQHIPMFKNMLPGLLHHHERWNGEGYPEGLVGMDIPLYGRIIAVADTFDAMTSDRPYQDKMSYTEAHELIVGWSGIRFDPIVTQAFTDMFDEIVSICENNEVIDPLSDIFINGSTK